MRHLITCALFVAAVCVCTVGYGPLFFGMPLLGAVLVAAAFGCELLTWRRVMHARSGATVRMAKN